MNSTIFLNGNLHPISDEITLDQLLESLGLAGKPVVVELDGLAVFPRDHKLTFLKDGARVEIVTLAAGG